MSVKFPSKSINFGYYPEQHTNFKVSFLIDFIWFLKLVYFHITFIKKLLFYITYTHLIFIFWGIEDV